MAQKLGIENDDVLISVELEILTIDELKERVYENFNSKDTDEFIENTEYHKEMLEEKKEKEEKDIAVWECLEMLKKIEKIAMVNGMDLIGEFSKIRFQFESKLIKEKFIEESAKKQKKNGWFL